MIVIGTSIESSIISGSTSAFATHLAKYLSAMPFVSQNLSELKFLN
jgi:hypothetical protein